MHALFVIAPELIPLVDSARRAGEVECSFEAGQTLKHLVEALGIPHTEIAALRVDGLEQPLDAPGQNGARIEVAGVRCQPLLETEARFILDNHLGRLAAYLRGAGFDCLYRNDYQDEELARVAASEERWLLTRDKRLLMRKAVRRGAWVRSQQPRLQLEEVWRRFQLQVLARPFTRCPLCNGKLQPVAKESILDRLQPLTIQYFEAFQRCVVCGQIYWRGSHTGRFQELLRWLETGPA